MTTVDAIDVPNREAPTSGADLVPVVRGAIVSPAAKIEEVLEANRAYHELYSRLLDPSDFQSIRGKRFPKKSAWRKLSLAFNVSTEIVSRDYERNDQGRIVRAEIVARATAPNGRTAEGLGACDLLEKCCDPTCSSGHTHCPGKNGGTCEGARHFSNPQHDLPATAETRAENRACSNLFGMGEVSAEEVNAHRTAAEAEERWDVGELLKPWLRQVYELDGGREALRTWTAENGYPERPKDFNQAQATALLVQIGRTLERSDGAPDPKASMPVTSSPGGSAKPAENIPANIPAPVVGEEDDGRPFDTEPGEPVDEAAPIDVATGEISADELAKRRGWSSDPDAMDARTAAHDILMSRVADNRITREAANAAWGEYGDHPTSDEHDAWVAKHLPVITPEVAEGPLAAGAERTPPGPSPSVLAAGSGHGTNGTSKRPSPLAAVRDAREQLARTAAATEAAEAEGLPF